MSSNVSLFSTDAHPLIFSDPIRYGVSNSALTLSTQAERMQGEWRVTLDSNDHGTVLEGYDGEANIRILWTVQENGYMDAMVIHQPNARPMQVKHFRSIAWGSAPGLINRTVLMFMNSFRQPSATERELISRRWVGKDAEREAAAVLSDLRHPENYQVAPLYAQVGQDHVYVGVGIVQKTDEGISA